MLLTGTYPRTLDDKKRLALPKRVRELLREPATLFAAPGPDQSLRVYTEDALRRLAEKLEQTPARPETRVFERLQFAQTEAIDVDRSGRILVSTDQDGGIKVFSAASKEETDTDPAKR